MKELREKRIPCEQHRKKSLSPKKTTKFQIGKKDTKSDLRE